MKYIYYTLTSFVFVFLVCTLAYRDNNKHLLQDNTNLAHQRDSLQDILNISLMDSSYPFGHSQIK